MLKSIHGTKSRPQVSVPTVMFDEAIQQSAEYKPGNKDCSAISIK